MDSLSTGSDSSPHTRPTLLGRLRDWEDADSWSEFYALYKRMIYSSARRGGLTHDEAQDVIQEVFKRVAETIRDFNPRPIRGSFRSWLMKLTRWKIKDRFRERRLLGGVGSPPTFSLEKEMMEMPDPEVDGRCWESDWRGCLLEIALRRLSRRVPAKQFQVFHLHLSQGWSPLRLAREMGINPATVYINNHRLALKLRREVQRLQDELG